MADYYLHKTAAHIDELLEKVEGLNNYDDTEVRGLINNKVDKETGKGLSTNDFTDVYKTELDGLDTALDAKVDKEIGKGLSTNDYTTSEKTKLNGIESGANVNVQADWNQITTTADDYIKNKPAIPDAQIQSDWNQTNTESKDFIKNKPPLGSAASKNYTASITSDSNDLVTSGAVYSAVSTKADLVDGKVPASQLPSYVDDVVEYASVSAFPETGESGKIYISTDTNKTYRWGGSAYVEISESLALGETSSTAYPGNKGKANADAIAKKPGGITTGKQYTIDGQTVTAGAGAEAFNDLTSNKAAGPYSHAEGYGTTASGNNSHAEGYGTTASGNNSHAEGFFTTASGNNSHAEGFITTASGNNSHAEGYGTTASTNQHVMGKSNVVDSSGTYAFIIGNGTGIEDDARMLHNAFAVDWNGLIYVNGASTGVDVSALAPQSTTYTKDEVDAALAAKINTSDVDTSLSDTSTNPVQNKAIQAPLAVLVGKGSKNLVIDFGQIEHNGCIFTYGSDGRITVTGTKSTALAMAEIISNRDLSNYELSAGDKIVAISDNNNVGLSIIFADDQGTPDSAISVYNETRTITIPSGRTKWYLRLEIKSSVTGAINESIKPMVCDKRLYDIDPTVTPYVPTNRELYEVQADSMKLVHRSLPGEISRTVTYQMKQTDFSRVGNTHLCGMYLIMVVNWSTTPSMSIYSACYSGGTPEYHTLTKIGGADAQLTINENAVITYTGKGKIQIYALR